MSMIKSMFRRLSRGFTLIEVNLAMLIMAGGILSIVGLYSYGFRENRQSREDVAAAAYADAVISPLVMAISSTNLKWSAFRKEFYYPNQDGWGAYFENNGIVKTPPEQKHGIQSAYDYVKNQIGYTDKLDFQSSAQPQSPKMSGGLVIMHPKDSAVVTIGFRAVEEKSKGTLLAMPLFYTEVRFQGLADK